MKKREELDKLRDMGDEELRAEAARLRESLFRLNFKLALGEVDAVKRIRQEKKSLARIETLSNERARQLTPNT
ncbi:MAG TPA: 50S ribosomal protein L29 [Pyrinomonadaceae bacterium]|nr:50S ribosomal protein L29 [Pyrinomonadaceae bacterium]